MQNGVGVLKGFTFVCRYSLNERLNEVDKSTLMMALYFHPHRDEKIGVGAQDIKVFSIEDETLLAYCIYPPSLNP